MKNNSNSLENTENQTKKSSESLKELFLKELYNKQSWSDEFVEKLSNSNNIDLELQNILEEELHLKPEKIILNNYEKYPGLNLSNISISELKAKFWFEIIKIKNIKDKIIYTTLSQFELEKSDIEDLESLNFQKLIEIEKWSIKDRKTKIEKILWKDVIEKSIFHIFSMFNIERKDIILNTDQQKKLEKIVNETNNTPWNLKWGDFQDLAKFWFFDEKEKKEVLLKYFPTISFKKAIDEKIILKDELDNLKTRIIKKHIWKDIENLDETKLKTFEELEIKTKDLLNKDNLDKIIEESFIDEYILTWEEAKIAKETKNNLEIKTFDEFVEKIEEITDVKFNGKFKKWNIFSFDSIIKSWRDDLEQTIYLKLHDYNDDNWSVTFHSKWVNCYNFASKEHPKHNYDTFISFLENKTKEFNTTKNFKIFTEDEIREKIKLWLINVKIDYIDYLSKEDLKEKQNKVKNQYDLRREELIKKCKNELWYYKEWDEKCIQILESDPLFNQLWKKYVESVEANLDLLKAKIKELDPNGEEHGFDEKTAFVTKDWIAFSIKSINTDLNHVVIEYFQWNLQSIDFNDFIKWVEDFWIERKSKAKSIEEVFEDQTSVESWRSFKVKDWKISKKEEKDSLEYNYLVWKDNTEIVRVNEINWGYVNVTFWEHKESKKEKEAFLMEDKSFNISISCLSSYITKYSLIPKSLEKSNNKEEFKDDRKGSILSRYFDNMSISDLLAWSKIWLESIEGFLKEWNEEKASRFASGYLGKFLPKELKNDLIAREESAWRKKMDDYKERLWAVDSFIAVKMIEEWLNNKNSSKFKVEAAMIFMLEGYGTLYAKWPLFKHKGSMLWYKALWGDQDIMDEYEEEIAAADLPFDEDELIFKLLKRQCRESWYKSIKRRSRIHKEFKWLRWKWQEDEWAKGEKDCALSKTIDWRVNYSIWELGWWTYVNAMWAFKSIIWKWGSIQDLNTLPFVMVFSGDAYSYNETMLDDFKNKHCPSWMLVPMTLIMSTKSWMDLLNDTIIELSKDYAEIYQDDTIVKRALEIRKNQKNSWDNAKEKNIKETLKFYKDYWEFFARTLNMLNTWKEDKFSKTDKLIFLKKDENPIYKKYFKSFSFWVDNNATFNVEEYMADAFEWAWTSGMHIHKAMKQNLTFQQWWGFKQWKLWPRMWKEFYNEIQAIKNRTYDDKDENKNRKIKEKLLIYNIRYMLAGIIESHGIQTYVLKSLNGPTSQLWQKLNKWWISMEELVNKSISSDTLKDESNASGNSFLQRYADNILDWKWEIEPWYLDFQIKIKDKASWIIDEKNYEDEKLDDFFA